MNEFLPALAGAGGVVALYLLYLATTKGLPAAWSAIKGWWTAGATELANVRADIAALDAKLQTGLADIAAVKAKVTAPAQTGSAGATGAAASGVAAAAAAVLAAATKPAS